MLTRHPNSQPSRPSTFLSPFSTVPRSCRTARCPLPRLRNLQTASNPIRPKGIDADNRPRFFVASVWPQGGDTRPSASPIPGRSLPHLSSSTFSTLGRTGHGGVVGIDRIAGDGEFNSLDSERWWNRKYVYVAVSNEVCKDSALYCPTTVGKIAMARKQKRSRVLKSVTSLQTRTYKEREKEGGLNCKTRGRPAAAACPGDLHEGGKITVRQVDR